MHTENPLIINKPGNGWNSNPGYVGQSPLSKSDSCGPATKYLIMLIVYWQSTVPTS